MTTDTIKDMGPHFHRAADSLADTLALLDNARRERLQFLRQCSKDSTARLAALKEEVRTLSEQIAKWDAEAARLESQTAEDMLRQALEPVREAKKPAEERGPVFGPEDHERCHYCKGLFLKPVEYHHTAEECAFLVTQVELGAVVLHPQPPGEVTEAPLTQPKPEPYRAGLPPERLRKVWAEWEVAEENGGVVFIDGGRYYWKSRGLITAKPTSASAFDWYQEASLRPHGATWARVEAMADEAERARATPQPAGKRAVVMVGDLPYYADSVSFDSAGKLIKGEGVPFGLPPVPQKPADPPAPTLLDLTKLPPGTVCEALEDIPRWNGRTVAAGVWFTLRDQSIVEGDEFPIVVTTNGENTYCIPALVPARVVKEGGEQ